MGVPILYSHFSEDTRSAVRQPHLAQWLVDTVTGQPPLQKTWFATAWNSREFRVLFHCEDTLPWATYSKRDDPLYLEEVVELFIDPVGDLQSYFELEVNPLNAVCDLLLRRTRAGLVKDFSWDCDALETEVNFGEGHWEAELSFPPSSLCCDLKRGSRWRANFYRIDRPKGGKWELSAWAPTGRPHFHVRERFGVLEFV